MIGSVSQPVVQAFLTLRHQELQHMRLPCPSPTPGACSDSCPLSWWCHPAISSEVTATPSAFNLAQHQGLFQWISSLHQVTKVMELQLHHQSFHRISRTWSPLGWTGWISLQSTLQHHSSKASVLQRSAFFIVQLSHPYMTTGKTIALTRRTFGGKAVSLLFHMLSRLVIAFLPRSKHLLISRLQSPSAVILEPKK